MRSAVCIVLSLFAGAAGCEADRPHRLVEAEAVAPEPVEVHDRRLGSVPAGRRDPATGRELRVRCATCHSMDVQAHRKHDAAELEDFHSGLSVAHGELGCRFCHAEERPDRLALADGETLPPTEAIRLCAQCHGPQHRDYRRGSHGGMTGHWDRTRGGRSRNHCVDCHDPHRPAIQSVQPVLPPAERRPLDPHDPDG